MARTVKTSKEWKDEKVLGVPTKKGRPVLISTFRFSKDKYKKNPPFFLKNGGFFYSALFVDVLLLSAALIL